MKQTKIVTNTTSTIRYCVVLALSFLLINFILYGLSSFIIDMLVKALLKSFKRLDILILIINTIIHAITIYFSFKTIIEVLPEILKVRRKEILKLSKELTLTYFIIMLIDGGLSFKITYFVITIVLYLIIFPFYNKKIKEALK